MQLFSQLQRRDKGLQVWKEEIKECLGCGRIFNVFL